MSTRVGYAGGTTENPSYYKLGDHTETLEIKFDPERITYTELLAIFWNSHNPLNRSWSRQYMSIILIHDQEQEALARDSKQRLEDVLKKEVYTEIQPMRKFYSAEDYHQKYYLQNTAALYQEVQANYDDFQDFVDSTAAARINGYVGGYGNATALSREIRSLGLSPAGQDKLKALIR